MLDKKPEKDSLIRNLVDAGLCEDAIKQFLRCHNQKKKTAQLKILTEYRGKLLGTVQAGQEKLYCLDYLIRKLKADQ